MKPVNLTFQCPEKKKNKILKDPPSFIRIFLPPILKLSLEPNLHLFDSLTSQLSTKKLHFKSQLASLYTVSKPYKIQLNPNRYNDHYISYASKFPTPYGYWTSNIEKIFTLQMKFLRPSAFNSRSEDSNPISQSLNQKRVHHKT